MKKSTGLFTLLLFSIVIVDQTRWTKTIPVNFGFNVNRGVTVDRLSDLEHAMKHIFD